jgi:hypothetical protein
MTNTLNQVNDVIIMTNTLNQVNDEWTGMVTSVPPFETFRLIKNNILHQSKNYKNHFKNSNF